MFIHVHSRPYKLFNVTPPNATAVRAENIYISNKINTIFFNPHETPSHPCDNKIAKMRTPLQIAASRANGSRSRGPVTAAGKNASSRNAVKHGILSAHVLLLSEKPETFLNLVAALYDEFQPATAFEESLVDAMAVARWRQQRIWNIERDAMDSQLVAEHDKNRAAMLNPGRLTSMAFGTLATETRTLDLANRYESRFDRQYLRCHRRLLEVQDRRLNSGPTPPPPGPQLVPKPAPEPTDAAPDPTDATPAPTDSTPTPSEPITPSVSAGNSSNTKRTQAGPRPFVRTRYRRRPISSKSPLPVHNLEK